MTTRQQILRSSTPGQVPAAGTRAPGELWTTFPDLQLGVIDASKTAQKLIAVRFFSAAASYAAGDFVIQAGALYAAKAPITAGAFNATQWTKVAAATDAGGPYLPIAGGTLTGPLVLAADPGAALGAATKQYVDGKVTAAPYLPLAGGTLTGKLTLAGPPTASLDAATKAYVDSGAFVPVAGGTMTGPLTLAANPAAPLQAATRQYVDALPAAMNDNRIINGDMRIDQRNNGASGTAIGVYTVDRWIYGASQAGKATWQRLATGSPSLAGGNGYNLSLTASAFTAAATDYFYWTQVIEADLITDFNWGTPQAQPVTLSFWVNSTLTGTFGGALHNYPSPSTRSYPFTYSIPTANVWTKIVVVVPGDTAGTWTLTGAGAGLQVNFDLGSGANYRGPANAWAAANYLVPTGAVSPVGSVASSLYLTGVKLEIGSVATPYPRQSLAKSMADCQRYYQTFNVYMVMYSGAAAPFGYRPLFPVVMRAVPSSIAFVSPTYANSSGITYAAANIDGVNVFATATAAGTSNFASGITASAEL